MVLWLRKVGTRTNIGCKIMLHLHYPSVERIKAKTPGETSAVRIAHDQTIDSALLFQRFLVVSKTGKLARGYELRAQSFPLCPL